MSLHRSTEEAEYDARYGEAEGHYDSEHIGYTPNFLRFMSKWVALAGKSPRALEVGCGDGFFSGKLAGFGCDVDAFDLSAVGIEKAKQRWPNIRFQVHNLTVPMPYGDGTFDVVWCSEVLEHLFSPLFVLQEIRRVLKPGGRLLCTVPYHGLIKNVAIALLAFERHYDPTYPHLRFFTRKSLTALASTAGLEIENVSTCGSKLGIRDWISPTNLLMVARRPPQGAQTA